MARPRFYSRKVAVGQSQGKGRGMFATEWIARGETIEVAPVLPVPGGEADEILTSFLGHYVFRCDRGDRYVLGLGTTSLFNHGLRPNAEFFVTTRALRIQAIRPIESGEEITIRYGWTAQEWERVGGRLD